ncbi:hypothetical protein ACFQPA_12450 [Halomarina halobia]|uniref:Uncharacterized protein n=1 Tax=Halomarina halobia TaxID=3033386 RepID=A0ABD6A9V1_9EURY|nr:hypothetical protein [Halomarina sp. PSR21]
MSQPVSGREAVAAVADDGRDSTRDLGQERHRILRELRRELERHPAVQRARGVPDGKFRELHADLDPTALGRGAERATLRVAWWPAPDDPGFAFHYSDSTGFDCGWHREPNPHVEGKTHYQERDAPDGYEYETATFGGETPSRTLWAVLDRLTDRL